MREIELLITKHVPEGEIFDNRLRKAINSLKNKNVLKKSTRN
jgi:hypothetical protein